ANRPSPRSSRGSSRRLTEAPIPWVVTEGMMTSLGHAPQAIVTSAVDLPTSDRYHRRKTMETVTLSSKYQLVLPRGARERLQLRPGMRITVLDKGGVIFLVPERPIRAYRGIVAGVRAKGLREKKDRF